MELTPEYIESVKNLMCNTMVMMRKNGSDVKYGGCMVFELDYLLFDYCNKKDHISNCDIFVELPI